MATAIGTNQVAWTKVGTTSATAFTSGGAGAYAHEISASGWGSSGNRFLIDLAPGGSVEISQAIRLAFFGKTYTDTVPNPDVTYDGATARVWLVSEITDGTNTNLLAMYCGELALTLGATAPEFGSGGVFGSSADGTTFVDTITPSDDSSDTPPGMRISGDVTGGIANVMIDTVGAKAVIVELIVENANQNIGLMHRRV